MDSSGDPQAPLDWFTDLDRKLDETNALLENLVTEQRQAGSSLAELASVMGANVETTPNREFPWGLSTVVPANTTVVDPHSTRVDIDYAGIVRRVLIGFPGGTQQAVGVQVGRPATTWIPRSTAEDPPFIAFDNEVVTVNLNEDVESGEPVEARFINNDPNNDHFINVLLLVEEK